MIHNTMSDKPAFGLLASFLLFGGAALVLFLETRLLIPFLAKSANMETVICWFVVSAFGMFIPLLLVAVLLLKKEGSWRQPGMWRNRLRFKKMTVGDWLWTLFGLAAVGLLSYLVMAILQQFAGEVNHQPPFMKFESLASGRYWILVVWFPYWIFNIMGEEILWRGVILPRQEASFGKHAWIINGVGWGLFHLAFGWQLLLTLLPILFILPWLAQKRKNNWTAVIIHALLNGPSFIAIALGVL